MASINAIISLTDRMTRPIQNIISSVNSLISVTERVATSMDNAFDVHTFDETRRSLDQAQREIEEIVNSTNRANQSQRNYNNEVRNGVSSTNNLLNNIKSLVGAYLGIQGFKSLLNISDNFSNTNARLTMLIDDGGSIEEIQNKVNELQDKIMSSANRARASYTKTADVIAQIGLNAKKAFNSNDEIIAFTELLNKSFVVSGASAEMQAAGIYQLNQALASGKLQGDEYRSITENASALKNAIEDYMINVQKAEGSMKDWASEGKLTADVIKASLFNAADEINNKFNSMPMTWGQVWNIFSNYALRATKPVLIAISWLANNISWLAPLIAGVGSAFIVFQIAANWTKIAAFATGLYNGAVTLLSIGFGILTGNTAAASAAMFTFNSALLANPITWIIMLILILIGILYAGVAAYNKFTNSSVSATGIIGGAFGVMVAFILNQLILLWNAFAAIANFIGNVFNNPAAAVKVLFYDLAQTVIGYIINMAQAIENVINKIPGVEVNITSGLDKFYNYIENAAQKVKDEAGWKEYVAKKDYIDLGAAALKGYDIGAGIGERVSDFFGGGEKNIPFDPSGYGNIPSIAEDANKIAGNTADIADEVATTNENMEYLRKMAERDVVMRYVTPSINVDMSGMSNNIKNGMDIDGVIDHIVRKTSEAAEGMAEGV